MRSHAHAQDLSEFAEQLAAKHSLEVNQEQLKILIFE